jgi:hypothetical protein
MLTKKLKDRLLRYLAKDKLDLVFHFNLVEYSYTGFSKEIYEVKVSSIKMSKNKIILSGTNGTRLYRK